MEMTETTETTRRGFVMEKRGSEMEMTETTRRGFVFLSLSNSDKKIRYYQEDGVAISSFPDSQMEFVSSGVPTMTLSKLKFISGMKCNAIYPDARGYLYAEFRAAFVWDNKIHDWRPRPRTYTLVDLSLLNILMFSMLIR
ncbi:hypothetical protein F2Q69_00023649 [Brassica cretica]|uniref:Uncharacterized protein n=1 Tax=Brassica cretica TaxID=69181 RepID=A0A8S9Q521_BRACR|nr:hypothetical protein F2Q69_00023649 [Brassica cretica]